MLFCCNSVNLVMIRKRISLLNGIILFLVLAVVILAWGIYRKSSLDSSSRELALATTQSIFTNNNAGELVQNAHQQLLDQMTAESLNSYLVSVRARLGQLDAIAAISGASDVALIPLGAMAPTANYEIDLMFAGNPATAVMQMIYQQGAWQFTDYSVQSELLFN